MMPPLRSDTTFLVLLVVVLLAALAITSMEVPGPPALAAPAPRPSPTATTTPEPGWWNSITFATPSLPALPGVPDVQLGNGGRRGSAGNGPISFDVLSCPTATARIVSINRNGVWWLIDGSAGVDSFWYWKMELSPDGSGWTVLYRSESPAPNGRLMEFNTTTVPSGQYQLRLTVVKKDGNYPQPCTVVVSL
jgi:hypothetical protein